MSPAFMEDGGDDAGSPVTAVFVSYRTPALGLGWIPPSVPVVVVHNDRSLSPSACEHPSVRHVFSGANVGFGAALNLALPDVQSKRVVVCNPDISFGSTHWAPLAAGDPDEVRTIPLADRGGHPTWVVNPYPTPASLLLSGYRVGRLLGRWHVLRTAVSRLLGPWGREHARLRHVGAGVWPLATTWVSGAAFSVDVERLQSVGGFDEKYFLYLEDVDLCGRLAARFPGMSAVVAPVEPAIHAVSGTVSGRRTRKTVDRHYLQSCRRYARNQPGLAWRICRLALTPRFWWLWAVR